MNRKKVLSILLLSLIAVTLVVSCSGNIDVPTEKTEELSYVTFGNGHSRELSTSYETEPYDLLYWFYTAEKMDNYGSTGAVGLGADGKPTEAVSKNGGAPTQGLSGRVGPFSQGEWKFTLYAYGYTKTGEGESAYYSLDKDNLVYKSSPVQVSLKGGDVKNVPVSVSLQGETGYVKLDNVTFKWNGNNGGTAVPTGKLVFKGSDSNHDFTISSPFVYSNGSFILNGSLLYRDGKLNIPEDFYNVTATAYLYQEDESGNVIINNEDTPLYKQTFGLRVYGNATTYIKGEITEGVFAEVVFDVANQDMKVFVPNASEVFKVEDIDVVPDTSIVQGVSKSTSVEFSAGSFTDVEEGANVQLDVSVIPVESANEKFGITGTTTVDNKQKSVYAGISLNLKQTTSSGVIKDIDSFNNSSTSIATITTYIARELSGVHVQYKAVDGGLEDFNICTSSTNDPGENVIIPEGYKGIYYKDTGKLVFCTTHFSDYYVLADCVAVNETTNVGYNNLQEAFDAVDYGQTISLTKDLTVNSQLVINKSITFNLKGFTLTSEKDFVDESGDNRFAIVVNDITTIENGTITVNKSRSITSHADLRLINVNVTTLGTGNAGINVGSYGGNLYIDGGEYRGEYSICSFADNHSLIIKNVTAYGTVYHNGSYKNLSMLIEKSTITGVNSEDSCGVYISGSSALGSLHDVTINNSSISGNTAIEVKFTNLTLNDCTVTATGSLSYIKNNNGSTSSGFAVISADNSMNEENASLNGTITINGGIYSGNISLSTSGLAKTDPEASYIITGGEFSDLYSAINYASDGAKIDLSKDVDLGDNPIEIKKSIEIDGNGHSIKCNNKDSNRVININDNTLDISFIIKNANIVGPTSGTYTRGISAYNNSGDLYIELDNCTVSANYYALNIASANTKKVEVVVKNSTAVAGWCAAQSWSNNAKFTFENSTLIGNNDKTYNAEGWNNFATIVINKNVNNNEFVFKNCRIKANQTTGNKQYLMSVRSSGNKVSLDGSKYFSNGTEIADDDLGSYLSVYSEVADLDLKIDGTIIPIKQFSDI